MKTVIPETPPDFDQTRIIERPDGFYWQDMAGKEYGPFTTLVDAVQDMEYNDASAALPEEPVEEAEEEIGVSDWIDPETGEPAEESVPRIEQH
ncbi:MAG TPA: hypothetical protein DHV08_11275 [Rhodocyclaceae bacterium]|nr:MAG: hypothetical protein AUK49_06485 [Betaproteobacteria bacterium CG2_30_68_42]PIX74095.1 MAG: hypothetical protein COZ38_11630 [Rhodocyclales bacterium CG_4_10_14_3_um_filter_68_10]HCX34071.1 hypothetical protein [Rhodocyclaceae bacterium]